MGGAGGDGGVGGLGLIKFLRSNAALLRSPSMSIISAITVALVPFRTV